jgi:hypothetical protein
MNYYTLFMSCETTADVNWLVNAYGSSLSKEDERDFYMAARNARRRIVRIAKEKKRSYLTYQLN